MKKHRVEDFMKLSLATARVVRAHLRDLRETSIATDINLDDDIAAMAEALEPFDPLPGDGVNEASD